MTDEMHSQIANKYVAIVKRLTMLKDTKISPEVCQMRRKRDMLANKVKSPNTRLTIDGSRMQKDMHHDEICDLLLLTNWCDF